jgi:Cell Wall Hydrolase
MRFLLLGLLTACGLASSPAAALPAPPDAAAVSSVSAVGATVDDVVGERDVFWETELYCMTLAIYFEGGSTAESEIGQRHIAHVISQRARANRKIWGGGTICGVVFHRGSNNVCQFSFACLPLAQRTAPHQHKRFQMARWGKSAEIAREELEGIRRDGGTRDADGSGDDGDTVATPTAAPNPLIRYYMNPQLTPLRNVCRFEKEFVPVIKAGRHDFFREPTSAERRALAQNEPESCKRYAAMLKAQKAKAKAKLAKQKAKHKQAAKASRKKAKLARR